MLDRLVTVLRDADDAEAVEWRTRWQQLTGPATAKGVEDRAFWRYVPLASLDEVGGCAEPDATIDPVAALHEHHAAMAARWPTTLLAGTTHDTKRAEDVRAGGLALAARARRWVELVDEWFDGPGSRFAIDLAIQWLALQTVVTTPGLDGAAADGVPRQGRRGRPTQHTAWTDADESYERQLGRLADVLLQWPPAAELQARRSTSPGGRSAWRCSPSGSPRPAWPTSTRARRRSGTCSSIPTTATPPDHDALDALVAEAAGLDGRAAWAEPGSPAARAVVIQRILAVRHARAPGRLRAARRRRAASSPSPASDASGDPVLVTIVPRAVERPSGLAVELPPGTWRHVLVDGEPDAAGRLDVDAAARPPSRRSSSPAADPRADARAATSRPRRGGRR